MTTDADRTDEIIRQNALLEEQNALLREQNNRLRQTTPPASDEDEIFIEDIDRDEMRSGFLVTSDRKRLWNAQIHLINEFARICEKHNLRWFAAGGTLIGAARHGGFIPWDDDVDIVMLRPEYEIFRKIVESEVEPPYYADIWYNHRLETDEPSARTDFSLPLISLEQFRNYMAGFPLFPIIKLRDKRTVFVEFPEDRNINQHIAIDIFPLDPLPPFDDEQRKLNFKIAQILFMATVHREIIIDAMQKNFQLDVDYDVLQDFITLPYKERGLLLEEFLAENFFPAEHVGDLRDWCIIQGQRFYQLTAFRDVTYLPFEKIELPAPVGYDSILTDFYGEWRKPVFTYTHAKFYSAEIPWEEFSRKTVLK